METSFLKKFSVCKGIHALATQSSVGALERISFSLAFGERPSLTACPKHPKANHHSYSYSGTQNLALIQGQDIGKTHPKPPISIKLALGPQKVK